MKYNEEDERAYTEWEMNQPGYWRDKFIIFIVLVTVILAVAVAV